MSDTATRRRRVKSTVQAQPDTTPKPPKATPTSTLLVLAQIVSERDRQDGKWGGPISDDKQTYDFWTGELASHVGWANHALRTGNFQKYRAVLLRIAALAVAAAESYDRGTAG